MIEVGRSGVFTVYILIILYSCISAFLLGENDSSFYSNIFVPFLFLFLLLLLFFMHHWFVISAAQGLNCKVFLNLTHSLRKRFTVRDWAIVHILPPSGITQNCIMFCFVLFCFSRQWLYGTEERWQIKGKSRTLNHNRKTIHCLCYVSLGPLVTLEVQVTANKHYAVQCSVGCTIIVLILWRTSVAMSDECAWIQDDNVLIHGAWQDTGWLGDYENIWITCYIYSSVT